MSSEDAEKYIPKNIMFSFIGGDHSYEAVMKDFKMMFKNTIDGGIIAIDDFKNNAWPSVIKAYDEITKNSNVKLICADIKAAYLMKKPLCLF